MSTQDTTRPVIIVGAGIAGLVLAQGLQHRGIPYELYERDDGQSRTQGYRIRLNLAGLRGLREILPGQVYEEVKWTCGVWYPGLTLYKHDGQPMMPTTLMLPSGAPGEIRPPQGTAPPPEINLDDELVRLSMCSRLPADREVLRSVLLKTLDPAHVHFGKSFDRTTVSEDGVEAIFEDGSASPLGSILIGADGANSKVASQTLGGDLLKPKPIGHKGIFGRSPLTPDLEARLLPGIDKGVHIAFGPGGLSLFIEVMRFRASNSPSDYVFWIVTDPTGFKGSLGPDSNLSALHGSPELEKISHSSVEGWHDGFRCIVELQDPSKSGIWALIASAPEIPAWPTNRRITYLGDVVHAVAPFGGLGGNMAIRSAQTLLQMLVEQRDGEGWSEAEVKAWGERMRHDAQTQSRLSREATGPTGRFPLPAWSTVTWDMAREMEDI